MRDTYDLAEVSLEDARYWCFEQADISRAHAHEDEADDSSVSSPLVFSAADDSALLVPTTLSRNADGPKHQHHSDLHDPATATAQNATSAFWSTVVQRTVDEVLASHPHDLPTWLASTSRKGAHPFFSLNFPKRPHAESHAWPLDLTLPGQGTIVAEVRRDTSGGITIRAPKAPERRHFLIVLGSSDRGEAVARRASTVGLRNGIRFTRREVGFDVVRDRWGVAIALLRQR